MVFKDADGRVVLLQAPNLPIIGWGASMVLAWLLRSSSYHAGLQTLGSAFLFTWAFLELTQGVNYFRRGLGLIVLAVVIYGFFR